MKFKKVTALCKSKGIFYIWNDISDDGVLCGQWLGTGGVMYALTEQPTMTEEAICAILDITNKQRENMIFKESSVPDGISVADSVENETPIDPGKLKINWTGMELIPLHTSRGIRFIQAEYLEPLGDLDDDVLTLNERISDTGAMTIVAKIGFFVAALISPYDAINNKLFVESVDLLARGCRAEAERRGAQ